MARKVTAQVYCGVTQVYIGQYQIILLADRDTGTDQLYKLRNCRRAYGISPAMIKQSQSQYGDLLRSGMRLNP